MSHLIENVIEKIKDGNIKPTPRWVFILKWSAIWCLFIISVLMGSIAVSLIIFQISDTDWTIYSQMSHNWLEFILWALPYFWIILMVIFLALAHYNLRHTKKGYKYNVFAVLGLSIILSIVLGGVFYFSRLSEKVEGALLSTIPQYEKLHYGKQVLWQRPEQGFLAGTVIELNGNVFVLQDLDSRNWEVDTLDSDLIPGFVLRQRAMVKMIGDFLDAGKFHAKVISPWDKCQMYR